MAARLACAAMAAGTTSPSLQDELESALRHLTSFERPSASDGERRAAEWIAAWLREEGCVARVEEAPAHGGFWWPMGLLNGLPALAALLGRRRLAAVLGAAAAAAIWDDVSGGAQWFRRRFLPWRTTYNVVAEAGDRHAARTAVLIAHHDAAHGGAVYSPKIPQFAYDRKPELFEEADRHTPLMVLVWLPPVVIAAGGLLGRRGLLRAGTAWALGVVGAMVNIGRSPVSPGASDNLAAVGALLAVARRLREEPVAGVRVVLLSTGSEESFMEGMQGFAARHFPSLPRATTDMLCLECLGADHMVAVEGEGMLKMRDYPPAAVEALAEAAAEEGVAVYRGLRVTLATDALVAERAGYSIATLASVDEPFKLPRNYHSQQDLPEGLNWANVMDGCRVAERWVRRRAAN
jgi:hypothetical protein